LYRIVVSESAHLIWTLQCAHRIEHLDDPVHYPSHAEISHRWLRAMNTRLHLDQELTRLKFSRRALSRSLVLDTWTGTLRDQRGLPHNWLSCREVLVGIDAREGG
ncbi:hypothetical protein WOLCODRAFT_62648, partial [Wolfiporia cocos MD-104 SS10]